MAKLFASPQLFGCHMADIPAKLLPKSLSSATLLGVKQSECYLNTGNLVLLEQDVLIADRDFPLI